MKFLQVNIYKDPLRKASLFGDSVLYSAQPILREDVPEGWYCYDLRGTDRQPDEPYALVDRAEDCHAGSVLSYLPLKSGRPREKLVRDMFQMTGTSSTLAAFCEAERVQCPKTPIRYMLRPASPSESELFYALPPEKDEELGAVGHVRIDFGRSGDEFWHTWWPRGPEALNTPKFQYELGLVIDDLRKGVLKDLPSMRRYCDGSRGAIEGGVCCQNYGFTLESDRYIYRLRCNPVQGDYQAYLTCFDKQAHNLAYELTPKGQQMLRDAADPDRPHTYVWCVGENILDSEDTVEHELPLEEAIEKYLSLDCEDKRLTVTKDGVASVDLAFCVFGDGGPLDAYKWSPCFEQDPVVADAATRLQQAMESQTHDQGMTMGGMQFG